MKVMFYIPASRFSRNVARDLPYGCWCKGKRIAGTQFPPVPQLQIATILRKEGHEVGIYDAGAIINKDKIIKNIINYDAVVVLTSTMTINEDAQILSEFKKTNCRLKTICFGSHPTFMPKFTLSKDGVDIAVRRESEFIIKDLINSMSENGESWKKVLGISYKENGHIVSNPDYPFINNLDILPIPDRRLLSKKIEYFNPVVKNLPFTTMFTSRGCHGRCIFCSSPPFYGGSIRYRSANRVLEELEQIQKLDYREVFFRDEMFTVPKDRLIQICKGILTKNIGLSWICSSRVDAVDRETMSLMKEAGCHMIRFGVESGVQKILDNVKKDITIDQIFQAFKWAREVNLDTHAHCMIGMPGETQRTINETIEFVKKIRPTIVSFGICTPYPGTKLFDYIAEKHPDIGDGSKSDLSKLHTDSFFNEIFTELSPEELSRSVRKSYREFYLRPSYIIKYLMKVNSLKEFRRIMLAGIQIFRFIFEK